MTTYGRTIGCVPDPMEKKPLYHFHPGSTVLSFGSVGCNMGCSFCQNAHLSKNGDPRLLVLEASPGKIAELALNRNCRAVAFTYNEPVVWAEYAVDAALACRAAGLRTVVVSSGYLAEKKRAWFFGAMDAANIDLKGFSDAFYEKEIDARLEPVKETLRFIARETDCWLELTTLIIPTLNDDPDTLRKMGDWIVAALGPEVPLHLSAFRPAHRRTDLPPTPPETLFHARAIAQDCGLRHVYTGNVADPAGQSTYCPQCRQCVVLRDGYRIEEYHIDEESCCRFCGQTVAGRFDE